MDIKSDKVQYDTIAGAVVSCLRLLKRSYPVKTHRLKWLIFLCIAPVTVLATEPPKRIKMNQELMQLLSPEPVINKGSDGQLTQLPDATDELLNTGLSVYVTYCASCHGKNLQGQPNWEEPNEAGLLPAPPHDETGHTWHHADDQLFEMVKYGPAKAMGDPEYKSMMPAFGETLSDNDILAVLAYIRSTWPESQLEWQRGANAAHTGATWWDYSDHQKTKH